MLTPESEQEVTRVRGGEKGTEDAARKGPPFPYPLFSFFFFNLDHQY